jgi:Uma2 family endonuclease
MSTIPNLGVTGGFVPAIQPQASFLSFPALRKFSVEEYYQLAEAGILRHKERVELLLGIVTMMSPIGPPHSTSVDLLYRAFLRLLPASNDYTAGRDVIFADSVTEPDGAVLRGTLREFSKTKATGANVALVIEVAETSLSEDRGIKQRVYAAAEIPEYWIVNLQERKLEVYRRPISASGEQPAKYEIVEVFLPDQSVDVLIDGTKAGTILVREILS